MEILKATTVSSTFAPALRRGESVGSGLNPERTFSTQLPVAEIVRVNRERDERPSSRGFNTATQRLDYLRDAESAIPQRDLSARARQALSAYANQQNYAQEDERAAISEMLGVDFYA